MDGFIDRNLDPVKAKLSKEDGDGEACPEGIRDFNSDANRFSRRRAVASRRKKWNKCCQVLDF